MPQHGTGQRDRTSGTAARRAVGGQPAPAHPLLALQRQAGNRAVSALVARRGGPLPVQRNPNAREPGPGGEPDVASAAASAVAVAPPLEEGALLSGDKVGEARQVAGETEKDLQELGLDQPGPLQDFFRRDLGGQKDPQPDVDQLRSASSEANLASPPKPPGPSPAGKKPGLFSRVGQWFKDLFASKTTHDVGGGAQAVGGVAAPVAGHAGTVATTVGGMVDNPVTEGSAHLAGGSEASDRVSHIGGQIGDLAKSAGADIAHTAGAVAGIFFSALKAAFDGRALFRSIQVVRGLKAARKQALATGAPQKLVDAVDYAIRQKYEKIIKRAIGMCAALATLGVGLALLVANPVGAPLAALIIGLVGLGLTAWKLGRWAFKDDKGKKRRMMANRLYLALQRGQQLAIDAVTSLHLDPDGVRSDPKGEDQIFRKLKSA